MGMKIKIGEAKFTPLDERKWYPARLVAVTEDVMEFRNKPQDKFRFDFVLLDPPDVEGREVDGVVNQPKEGEITERHTLYAWMTVLLDGVPPSVGDEIDFPDQFIGKIVYVKVKSKVKTYEGKDPMTFQNVEKLAICPDAAMYEDRAPLPGRDDDGPPGSASSQRSGAASGSATRASSGAGSASPGSSPDATPSGASGAGSPSQTTHDSPTTDTPPPKPKATVDVPGKGKKSIPF